MKPSSSPCISVILPAFNTASFLGRCIDSVLAQTFRDFELICIDDGSSDATLEIMRTYEASDPRVRVFHLENNSGVPYARNLAMDEARGEYVYFIDSDDWIDIDYLEAMHRHAESMGRNVIINSNWYLEYDDPSKRTVCDRYGLTKEEPWDYPPVLVQSHFFPVVWTRLYRLKYLRDNNIKSPLLKGGVEDNYFTALAEILQDRSYVFRGPFYHYYQRPGSLVRQPEAAFHHMENFRIFLDELHRRGMAPSAARRFYVLDSLLIDTPEKFDFIRKYFQDVESDVLACSRLYTGFDVFVMRALLSCPDFGTFRTHFSPRLHLNFIAKAFKTYYPSADDVLTGTWMDSFHHNIP